MTTRHLRSVTPCRDLLVKNLKRARKALEREGRAHEYDFFPQTFVLPSEYNLFAEEFRRSPGARGEALRACEHVRATASGRMYAVHAALGFGVLLRCLCNLPKRGDFNISAVAKSCEDVIAYDQSCQRSDSH